MKWWRILPLALLLALLSGCSSMLQREYQSVKPHSAAYWESEAAGILRADEYQALVNDILLLVTDHTEDATIRLYGTDAWDTPLAAAEEACREVQQDSAMGAYAVEYIAYSGTLMRNYYELEMHIDYRRSKAQQQAIVNVTSTDAIADLIASARERGEEELTVHVSYFDLDLPAVYAMAAQAFGTDVPPLEPEQAQGGEEEADSITPYETPDTQGLGWQLSLYPNEGNERIIEFFWENEKIMVDNGTQL